MVEASKLLWLSPLIGNMVVPSMHWRYRNFPEKKQIVVWFITFCCLWQLLIIFNQAFIQPSSLIAITFVLIVNSTLIHVLPTSKWPNSISLSILSLAFFHFVSPEQLTIMSPLHKFMASASCSLLSTNFMVTAILIYNDNKIIETQSNQYLLAPPLQLLDKIRQFYALSSLIMLVTLIILSPFNNNLNINLYFIMKSIGSFIVLTSLTLSCSKRYFWQMSVTKKMLLCIFNISIVFFIISVSQGAN